MEVRNRNSGAQQHSHPRAPLLEWAPPRANVLAASERLMIKRRGYFCLCFFPTTARASLPQRNRIGALLGNNILGEVLTFAATGRIALAIVSHTSSSLAPVLRTLSLRARRFKGNLRVSYGG